MTDYTLPQWHYRFGQPEQTGTIRTLPEHFQVEEMLPFRPDGEGENHLIHIEKRGLTTHQVAKQLAQFAQVPVRDVSWAGLKDKHGVTRQWLCVRIPGKNTPNWQELNSDELTILESDRTLKKLRPGALMGNRFRIAVAEIEDMAPVLARLEKIRTGVPNYYGEQRFGHNGMNVARAAQMFAGRKVKDRNKRSIYLSAARSFLFNHVVSERLAQHGMTPMDGDAVMLSGSNSFFIAEPWDEATLARLQAGDVALSAPLFGDGGAGSQGDAAEFEQRIVAPWSELLAGLSSARLSPERRRLLLKPEGLTHRVEEGVLWLEFMLPPGAFATSILRELVNYRDAQAYFSPEQEVDREPVEMPERSEQSGHTPADDPEPSPSSDIALREASIPDASPEPGVKPSSRKSMKILVSNDDGVHAPGIKALSDALTQVAQITTVAPDRNCSGASNSLTLTNPLRTQTLENGYIQVNGTPTDCVHLAIRELIDEEPDLVVSGVNAGANLGDDTLYSGTVAAAMEGRHLGLPAIAVSLVGRELKHYDTAAQITRQIVELLMAEPLPKEYILNINVPDCPMDEIKGIKVTRLGNRHKSEGMVRTTDPAGRRIFWLGPPGLEQDAGEGTDFHAVAHGYVSITPLKVDLTAHQQLDTLKQWVKGL
ncbi:hypothetical protein GCM10025772_21710 [Ferrimonas gelatinilytica]|uniref:Multifunctional fusion protein n=2 Tax=Ferrimonas gelatinilytica TaxID=1255257 RepID=A0ABP9SAJ5_9GAMM